LSYPRPTVRSHVMSLLAMVGLLLLTGCGRTAPSGEQVMAGPAAEQEVVVLVHGLARSRLSMLPLEWSLESAGYRVLNYGYSSLSGTVPEHGADFIRFLEEEVPEGTRVHFVGHSMGNLLIRWALTREPREEAGRVVMLAPPNNGSESADRWLPYLSWIVQPLEDLTTEPESTARSIPPVDGVGIGVIAGAWDGKVSPEESWLPEARDHTFVCATHTFLMMREDVRTLTLRFLRDGRFEGESLANVVRPLRSPEACGTFL